MSSIKTRDRFRQPHTYKLDCVRLFFPQTPERTSLYAHSSVLAHWSEVLRHIHEDVDGAQSEELLEEVQSETPASGDPTIANEQDGRVITLYDTETVAWEEALEFMYPGVPLPEVTDENAHQLLLLADKYHMPCLIEYVRKFLANQAASGPNISNQNVTERNVITLLRLSCRLGLSEVRNECVSFIVSKQVTLPANLASTLEKDTLQQLLHEMQKQATADRAAATNAEKQLAKAQATVLTAVQKADKLESQLSTAIQRSDEICNNCECPLFYKPEGWEEEGNDVHCVNCGQGTWLL